MSIFTVLAAKARGPNSRTKGVSTTNIWHLRERFRVEVVKRLGPSAAKMAESAIASSVTCYAAKLHLNRATAITNPSRQANKGYAPVFERLTRFPGRVAKMACDWGEWPEDLRVRQLPAAFHA